jgi:antirestriction protein ArdC
MKKDIKTELVNLISAKIESSQRLPWDKGLLNHVHEPVNAKTMHAYRGINYMILSFLASGETSEFVTFKQVQELGGKVKKGAKSLPVVYWSKWNQAEHRPAEEGDEEEDCYFFLKHYRVFEIESQTDGIERRREVLTRPNMPIEEAEKFIATFAERTGVEVTHETSTKAGNGSAYYRPSAHRVQIPPREEFKTSEAYVATFFHELVHSTGKAMKRATAGLQEDREKYSREEVVAEFGAALLCKRFGIESQTDNTAAYLQGWSEALRENPDWLINGANAAQKAVDYMIETVSA